MKGKALALCAGLGLALTGGCRERPEEFPVPDETIRDQQGPPTIERGGAPHSYDEEVPAAPIPPRESPVERAPENEPFLEPNQPQMQMDWGEEEEGIVPHGRLLPGTPRLQILPARHAPQSADENLVRGKVRYVGPRMVKVEDSEARWYELALTGDTKVTQDGRNASALSFVDGTLLEATYRVQNGELIATSVEVLAEPAQKQ